MVSTVISGIAGSALFGAVAVVATVILLVTSDLADASGGSILRLFSRHLAAAVIPLLVVSVFTVIMKVLQAIS